MNFVPCYNRKSFSNVSEISVEVIDDSKLYIKAVYYK